MTAKIIDGKTIAAEVRNEAKVGVDELKASGITPCLAAVLVGDVQGRSRLASLRKNQEKSV
jgi:methylenetetrahydrofolate dehydrogenase (NADP+)/methenyltetrahydrofolate cyclohydrolase